MKFLYIVALVLTFNCCSADAQPESGKQMSGFILDGALIPTHEIRHGGPPRDGIPSIDRPQFKPASEDTIFPDDHRILGVFHKGVAKAYPIGIMDWHEIVNDQFATHPVVITYCPLCGSGIAFDARIDGKAATFGVSGLLYNSDVLLYDRQTESLWSQIMAQAVTGRRKGKKLTALPTANTTLGEWKEKHPNTLILTTQTGYAREYGRTPYAGYTETEQLYFPVTNQSNRFSAKELVIGIEVNGKFKAYPFSSLKKLKNGVIQDEFNGARLSIEFDKKAKSATIKDESGSELPGITLFWFAWYAFHPDTEVFQR